MIGLRVYRRMGDTDEGGAFGFHTSARALFSAIAANGIRPKEPLRLRSYRARTLSLTARKGEKERNANDPPPYGQASIVDAPFSPGTVFFPKQLFFKFLIVYLKPHAQYIKLL